MNRRVAVTGLGILSPIGLTTRDFWRNCLAGRTSVAPIPVHWHQYHTYSSQWWAPLPSIPYDAYGITRVERMQRDPAQLLACAAAVQALADAGIESVVVDEKKCTWRLANLAPDRGGVFVGTGAGGIVTFAGCEANHVFTPALAALKQDGTTGQGQPSLVDTMPALLRMPPRFNPFAVSMVMPNACSAALGIRYGLTGANATECSACAAGTAAIGRAYEAVRDGAVDYALAGAAEYLGDDFGGIFRAFDTARTLARGEGDPLAVNRPFDRGRTGFLFCEGGGAMLVLEDLDHARARGANPIAEVAGYAESFDAYSVMSMRPDAHQARRMLGTLLDSTALRPDDVDYINAHGTGTEVNDDVEAGLIAALFGRRPLVNATKSLTGHAIGASGAFEAAVTVLSIRDQTTHACRNLESPVADLNFARTTQRAAIDTAVTQSFAFGGHNAALLMRSIR